MRISKAKKNVTACDEVICEGPECIVEIPEVEVPMVCDSTSCKFDAYHHIMEAIEDLKGCDIECDPTVAEAISNLAVVAYSLK